MSPSCSGRGFAARSGKNLGHALRQLRRGNAGEAGGRYRVYLIVILSDINMPGMDGLTLLREIKAKRPDLSVMMVTACGDDERHLAEEYGAAQFVTKPVDFDLLKAQLRQLSNAAD